uniref:Transmembrane protein n=1 Tax=Corethron hystrix TaxID=216773 RepID=A0A7S1BR19_9STRA|mmetsp:Transcript_36211/g.84677  ORF Transcript_36211/g.84677 Transcript_36211/m.84677 type:complete len:975 (+) Transcript_36211:125-3049(+)
MPMVRLLQIALVASWTCPASTFEMNLVGVDQTAFNFFTGAFSDVLVEIFNFFLAGAFTLAVNLHLRRLRNSKRGSATVPLRSLGFVPNNIFSSLQMAELLRWSSPAVLFAVILAVNHSSHNLARLGIRFVSNATEGPSDYVLSLDPNGQRNEDFPVEMISDSSSMRTHSYLKEDLPDTDTTSSKSSATSLMSFVFAVDDVARGISPLLSRDSIYAKSTAKNERMGVTKSVDSSYAGIRSSFLSIFSAREADYDGYLTGIDLMQPLKCEGMIETEQIQGYGNYPYNGGIYDDQLFVTSTLPKCDFSHLRSSGIFLSPLAPMDRVKVTAILQIYNEDTINVYHATVTVNGEKFSRFFVPPASRRLAKDRSDPRLGRLVESVLVTTGSNIDLSSYRFGSIDTVNIGSVSFRVGAAVLVAGKPVIDLTQTQNDDLNVNYEYRDYFVVVEIKESVCPLDPDGYTAPSCLAIVNLVCQTFPEESAAPWDKFECIEGICDDLKSFGSLCTIQGANIFWGENFRADNRFAAAVAGVYGRNVRLSNGPRMDLYLKMHLIPAAVVLMASLDTMPAVKMVEIVQIDGIYIFFTLLPLLSTVLLFFMGRVAQRRGLNIFSIPIRGWEMAVVGSENVEVEPRLSTSENFPRKVGELRYGIVDEQVGEDGKPQLGVKLYGDDVEEEGIDSNAHYTDGANRLKVARFMIIFASISFVIGYLLAASGMIKLPAPGLAEGDSSSPGLTASTISSNSIMDQNDVDDFDNDDVLKTLNPTVFVSGKFKNVLTSQPTSHPSPSPTWKPSPQPVNKPVASLVPNLPPSLPILLPTDCSTLMCTCMQVDSSTFKTCLRCNSAECCELDSGASPLFACVKKTNTDSGPMIGSNLLVPSPTQISSPQVLSKPILPLHQITMSPAGPTDCYTASCVCEQRDPSDSLTCLKCSPPECCELNFVDYGPFQMTYCWKKKENKIPTSLRLQVPTFQGFNPTRI